MFTEAPFYHSNVRRIVVAFGQMFSDISISREDSDGKEVKRIKVPISYIPKSKWFHMAQNGFRIDSEDHAAVQQVLPRMGFEIVSMFYDSQRKLNTVGHIGNIQDGTGELREEYLYNPVPYTITFGLNIAAKNTNDLLRIVEQIVPFFTPHFTVGIRDIIDPNVKRDIPIYLQAVDLDTAVDGDFREDRIVTGNLTFNAHAYIYGPTQDQVMIKRARIEAMIDGNDDAGRDIVIRQSLNGEIVRD